MMAVRRIDERGTGSDWASLSKAWPSGSRENYAITFFKLKLHTLCMQYCFHNPILSHFLSRNASLGLSSTLFLILSVSPCILLSVMSALCVQRSGRVADYFLIYLQAAEHIEQLIPAQYSCADELVCMHTQHLGVFKRIVACVYLCLCVCVHVFGMCSSLAVPQEGSVGLWACSPPASLPTSQHGRFSEASSLSMYYFFFLSPTPALPLASPFLGIQLSDSVREWLKEADAVRICLSGLKSVYVISNFPSVQYSVISVVDVSTKNKDFWERLKAR